VKCIDSHGDSASDGSGDQPAKAVILAPAGPEHDLWTAQCARFCADYGCEVIAVTPRWADAVAMIESRSADLIVVAKEEHLDPNRMPRLVVVEQAAPRQRGRRGNPRRPRIINR
jgi:hypothetical protein